MCNFSCGAEYGLLLPKMISSNLYPVLRPKRAIKLILYSVAHTYILGDSPANRKTNSKINSVK